MSSREKKQNLPCDACYDFAVIDPNPRHNPMAIRSDSKTVTAVTGHSVTVEEPQPQPVTASQPWPVTAQPSQAYRHSVIASQPKPSIAMALARHSVTALASHSQSLTQNKGYNIKKYLKLSIKNYFYHILKLLRMKNRIRCLR